MTRLAQAFWVVAALDAALLAVILVMSLGSNAGRQDGGRAMGLFFFVLVPAVVLVLTALTFHLSSSAIVQAIALGVVLVPGLWWAKVQVEEQLIERRIVADQAGVGYFDTDAMRRMGAAVVQRDAATLLRLGRTVDVNAPGRDNMTLLRLALQRPDARESDGSELPTVRALLELGAHADEAMHDAAVRTDPALLEMVFAAGGNANLQTASGQPLIFDVMSSITPRSFRMLVTHGLDLDSVSLGDPLPVQLAIYRRWDLLLIAIELGADTTRTRTDGRSVASELATQANEEQQAGRTASVELQQARMLLAASTSKR